MKSRILLICSAVLALSLAGCGQVGEGNSSETEPLFTSTAELTKRTVRTTKTAMYINGEVDADDEDAEGGYSTTTTITGSLENEAVFTGDDEPDADILATQTTEAKTYYSVPEHNGTTAAAMTVSEEATTTTKNATVRFTDKETTKEEPKTTTTAIVPTSLFKMEDSMQYSSDKAYTVTSDTTFLNLRYGPSKEYDIRLKIPDGESVTGYGETVGPDGNVWVYTAYNGTVGWVMRELLS